MSEVRIWAYRFHLVAQETVYFPPNLAGNILRGAFGTIFRRIACEPSCLGPAQCSGAHECPYAQVFEPRWEGGPSGLADPPRAFVFRPTGFRGDTIPSGGAFYFDLHLFSGKPDLFAYFVLAFRQMATEGVGPRRAKVLLTRITTLDRNQNEGAVVYADGVLAGNAVPGIAIPLASALASSGLLRVHFLSPTEFKESGEVAVRPEFGTLFRRLSMRVGNLCTMYQGGRPTADYQDLIQAADRLRIVGGTVSWSSVERKSSKTKQRHQIGGFVGWVDYEGEYGAFLAWLEAGRWVGVGRQTVWGKGWMEVSNENSPVFKSHKS